MAQQLSQMRICFDYHNIKDKAVQIASPHLPSTPPSNTRLRSYGQLNVTARERGVDGCGGAEVSAPHFLVLTPSSYLTLQYFPLTGSMPEGG